MDIATEVAVISAIVTATTFVVKKIVGNVKHETLQNETIANLQNNVEEMNSKIKKLECADKDRELTIISIKEKMESLVNAHETTQTMITQLNENQQKTFSELIHTIQTMNK